MVGTLPPEEIETGTISQKTRELLRGISNAASETPFAPSYLLLEELAIQKAREQAELDRRGWSAFPPDVSKK